jgi:hypothetical protein
MTERVAQAPGCTSCRCGGTWGAWFHDGVKWRRWCDGFLRHAQSTPGLPAQEPSADFDEWSGRRRRPVTTHFHQVDVDKPGSTRAAPASTPRPKKRHRG